MDATPIDLRNARLSEGAFAPSAAVAPSGCGSGAGAHADVIGMKWAALHDAAAVAARIAGIVPDSMSPQVHAFPALVRSSQDPRRVLAERGVSDLIAVLEPGLAGLLCAHSRGVPLQAAAGALWSEFTAARDALVCLMGRDLR